MTKIIRTSKENYQKEKLNQDFGNSKKTWETVNTLLGRKQPKLPSTLVYDDSTINDPLQVAQTFNTYFSNIGITLADNIPEVQPSYNHYLPPPTPFSFYLRPTTLSEVKINCSEFKMFLTRS